MGGRLMFPAFPGARRLPWVLLALSLGSLLFGLFRENEGALVLGVVGFAFVALAYGAARLALGGAETPEEPGPGDEAR